MKYAPLYQVGHTPPTWLRVSTNVYDLRAGDLLFAHMIVDDGDTWAEMAAGQWAPDTSGTWAKIKPASLTRASNDRATLHHDPWRGRHYVQFASGRVFRWNREGGYNSLLWT